MTKKELTKKELTKKELFLLRQGLIYCWDAGMIKDPKVFTEIYKKLIWRDK